MLGLAQYFAGDHTPACSTLEQALEHLPAVRRVGDLGVDGRMNAHNAYARALWFRGFADQALAVMDRNLQETLALDHSVTLCNACMWSAPVSMWVGDLDTFERHVALLIDRSRRGALVPSRLVGRAFQGVLLTRRGEPGLGREILQESISGLVSINYRLLHVLLLGHLAEALAGAGEIDGALDRVLEALSLADDYGDLVNMPHLLKQRGDYLLLRNAHAAARQAFHQAFEWARRQDALAVELQIALSLGDLEASEGRQGEAYRILSPIYERFTEGFVSADLRLARQRLDLWSH
jgi:tetratricopeptide (TPR) repeat protein